MPRLDHMEVPVSDYVRTRDWYRDNLGFELVHTEPAYAIVERDGVGVHFWGPSGIPPERSDTMFRIRVEGIDIELTNKTSGLTGSVSGSSGQVKDYTVVVFPTDDQKWTLPQNRWMASARPDQEGRFRFGALPPGDYYAIALEYVAEGEWQDPEWLARAAKTATKFTLDEGASRTLDLKLSGS